MHRVLSQLTTYERTGRQQEREQCRTSCSTSDTSCRSEFAAYRDSVPWCPQSHYTKSETQFLGAQIGSPKRSRSCKIKKRNFKFTSLTKRETYRSGKVMQLSTTVPDFGFILPWKMRVFRRLFTIT